MTNEVRNEILRELESAELMVKDLKRIWKSYAKKALIAKTERELKQDKKGFLEYETLDELIDGYGWGNIDEETYYRGLEYFENLKKPPQKSVIEEHRANIKELLSRYEGTVIELNAELNPVEKVKEENAFERREREEREEQNSDIALNELLG